LVDTFLRFAQNSFEEPQAATCHFSTEFCENLGNVSTNIGRKGLKFKRIVHALSVFKSFVISKAFGVKWQKT
jgi:hypothetical protein